MLCENFSSIHGFMISVYYTIIYSAIHINAVCYLYRFGLREVRLPVETIQMKLADIQFDILKISKLDSCIVRLNDFFY